MSSEVRPGAPGFPHTVHQGAKTVEKTRDTELSDEERERLMKKWIGIPKKKIRMPWEEEV